MEYVRAGGVSVARALKDFIDAEALPGTGIGPDAFWAGLGDLLGRLVHPDGLARDLDEEAIAQRFPNRPNDVEIVVRVELMRIFVDPARSFEEILGFVLRREIGAIQIRALRVARQARRTAKDVARAWRLGH